MLYNKMDRETARLRYTGDGSDYALVDLDVEKAGGRVTVDSVAEVPDGEVAHVEVDEEGDTEEVYYEP